jgi:hypothetical protein
VDLTLAFHGSHLPVPGVGSFKNGVKTTGNDVVMIDEKQQSESAQSDDLYPGRIIPIKSFSSKSGQLTTVAQTVVVTDDNLDDGEIVEVQAPLQNTVNGSNSQFIEINKSKGAAVFLNVTNLSTQKIRVDHELITNSYTNLDLIFFKYFFLLRWEAILTLWRRIRVCNSTDQLLLESDWYEEIKILFSIH